MTARSLYPFIATLPFLAAAACGDATGTVSGGDPRFDASAPIAPEVMVDAGPLGTGHTFTELYQDFWGNVNRASCSGDGACHGAPNQPGSQASGGYVCPLGDPKTCYETMVAKLLTEEAKTNPEDSYLYSMLRKASGGSMPKRPPYTFSETDLARIRAWMMAGYPND